MDDVTTPKKVNIPLLVLLAVVLVAVIVIFTMRSSPDVETSLDGPVPNPPAATDPDLTKPKSPEQSPGPGATSDTSTLSLPPSTR